MIIPVLLLLMQSATPPSPSQTTQSSSSPVWTSKTNPVDPFILITGTPDVDLVCDRKGFAHSRIFQYDYLQKCNADGTLGPLQMVTNWKGTEDEVWPTIRSVQIIIDPVQAKYPGNNDGSGNDPNKGITTKTYSCISVEGTRLLCGEGCKDCKEIVIPFPDGSVLIKK